MNALPSPPDLTPGFVDALEDAIRTTNTLHLKGRVIEVQGTVIKAIVPSVRIGEICLLQDPARNWELASEVVGFGRDAAVLMPLGRMTGISVECRVVPTGESQTVPVGMELLGRIVDGCGKPLDEATKGPLSPTMRYALTADPPHPLQRAMICRPLPMGLRAIDGLLTCGEGQRIGIFAAAGVGKSTLLASLVRSCEADVAVVALIGERSREVREFIERNLGNSGLQRSVVVVSTSDRPALERLRAAFTATAIAEYFRDQNKRVLLVMDSVTRFARAQREIGLAAGEPPVRRGFPPSVFSLLPLLMERAGPGARGSITALYTVLVEGDDLSEPVADETISLLDGHIVLSRKLAAAGHYPAIDVCRSVSRLMGAVTAPEHRAAATQVRELMAKYDEIELLLQIGEYKKGTDPKADRAIDRIEPIRSFLRQKLDERTPFHQTVAALRSLAQ